MGTANKFYYDMTVDDSTWLRWCFLCVYRLLGEMRRNDETGLYGNCLNSLLGED